MHFSSVFSLPFSLLLAITGSTLGRSRPLNCIFAMKMLAGYQPGQVVPIVSKGMSCQ